MQVPEQKQDQNYALRSKGEWLHRLLSLQARDESDGHSTALISPATNRTQSHQHTVQRYNQIENKVLENDNKCQREMLAA